jgi:hypothetical protein
MSRPPAAPLLAIAAAVAVGTAGGCGEEGSEGVSAGTAEFCADAPDHVDGLASVEVLVPPGSSRSDLAAAHEVIQAELADATQPSGTPEADAVARAIEDVLALSPQELGTPAGAKTIKTARERIEDFQAAGC